MGYPTSWDGEAGYPSESHLTTLKCLKDWLKVTDTGTGVPVTGGATLDQILKSAIERCSLDIVNQINRPTLFAKDITLVTNGNGRDVLFSQVYPINSVTSVTIDDIVIPVRPTTTGSGFAFDDDCVYLSNYIFNEGVKNVTIVMNAGIATTHRYAGILEQALLEMIQYRWSRRKHTDTITEKSNNFLTVQYSEKEIPDEARRVINYLRNRLPVY